MRLIYKVKNFYVNEITEVRYLNSLQFFIANLFSIPYIRKFKYKLDLCVSSTEGLSINDMLISEEGVRFVILKIKEKTDRIIVSTIHPVLTEPKMKGTDVVVMAHTFKEVV